MNETMIWLLVAGCWVFLVWVGWQLWGLVVATFRWLERRRADIEAQDCADRKEIIDYYRRAKL